MRKTGNDYLKEYKTLTNKQKRFEAEVNDRLMFLAEKYPQLKVNLGGNEVLISHYVGKIIEVFKIEERIKLIIAIEKWCEQQNTYKQLSLF